MISVSSIREFVAELRRRRVVRVIIVYAGGAYVMIEVAGNLARALNLPEWTDSFVVLIALIGFPLAVILAWAYEITPEGVRRTEPEPPGRANRPAAAPTNSAVPAPRPAGLRRAPPRREPPRTVPSEASEPPPRTAPEPGDWLRAMLATLRHELRTPLGAVIGYSELLLEDVSLERAAPLRAILTSGQRLLALVNEILRPDATEEELTEESLDRMRKRIREELSEPAQGLVEQTESAMRSLRGTEEIATDDLERIHDAAIRFRELVRSEVAAPGTPDGAGATSGPTREVAARVIAGLPRGGRALDEIPPKHGQILVVDDHADNRDLLSRQLARQGFSVSAVGDGESALQSLRAHDFDLVLLDVLMPGLDGIEVLRQMQRDPATGEIPVIMTSAMDEIEGVVRCIEQGAVDYLIKPFDPVLLQARVSATLDLHRLRGQQRRARQELQDEVAWSGRLIRSLVPDPLVNRLREGRGTVVEGHDAITALAVFIQGLGTFATRQGTSALGDWMTETMAAFQALAADLPVEVHWEAGATFMASTGTHPSGDMNPEWIAELALRLREEAVGRARDAEPVRIGIGVHTGPAVTAIIDGEKVAYGLWGEAPDVARELAWLCPAGSTQVSPGAFAALHGTFAFEAQGIIETSFRSQMRVYDLVGRREVRAGEPR